MKTPITVAKGDGIGPEITDSVLFMLDQAGANLEIHSIEIGEKIYKKGIRSGIEEKAWETIRGTEGFLKGPITTPQGGGFQSVNVTLRTTLGLYANVRPCVSYAPFVSTKHPRMDVVVVRENEEDLYTGIEYQQTPDVRQALKIITRTGCEKICRFAFEYAKTYNRKKVTCFTKDNILKLTDGLFHRVFDEMAKDYPEIENEHWIVDIGAAKLADTPEAFDVLVLPNLYGDILSDVAAQIAGSVGLAGSANIGKHAAMFEAIHGSAPRRAGQNLANPSGLLLAAIMMLVHIGKPAIATTLHNAWLKTIEEGIHTYDIFTEGHSRRKLGTKEFSKAVCQRLGQKPEILPQANYGSPPIYAHLEEKEAMHKQDEKTLIGVDVYIESHIPVEKLKNIIDKITPLPLKLTLITNRSVCVWPQKSKETTLIDLWRCRFQGEQITHKVIVTLLERLSEAGVDFVQTQNLISFDGKAGFSS